MRTRAFVYFALRLDLVKRSMAAWRRDGCRPVAQEVRVKDVGFYRRLMRQYFHELVPPPDPPVSAPEYQAVRG